MRTIWCATCARLVEPREAEPDRHGMRRLVGALGGRLIGEGGTTDLVYPPRRGKGER